MEYGTLRSISCLSSGAQKGLTQYLRSSRGSMNFTNDTISFLYATLCKPVTVTINHLTADEIRKYTKVHQTPRKRKYFWKHGTNRIRKRKSNEAMLKQCKSQINKQRHVEEERKESQKSDLKSKDLLLVKENNEASPTGTERTGNSLSGRPVKEVSGSNNDTIKVTNTKIVNDTCIENDTEILPFLKTVTVQSETIANDNKISEITEEDKNITSEIIERNGSENSETISDDRNKRSNKINKINSDSWKFRRKRSLTERDDAEDMDFLKFSKHRLKYRRRIESSDEEDNKTENIKTDEINIDKNTSALHIKMKELQVVLIRLEDATDNSVINTTHSICPANNEIEEPAQTIAESDINLNSFETPPMVITCKRKSSYNKSPRKNKAISETPKKSSISDSSCDISDHSSTQASSFSSYKSFIKNDALYKNLSVALIKLETLGIQQKDVYSASEVEEVTRKRNSKESLTSVPTVLEEPTILQLEDEECVNKPSSEPMSNWKLHSMRMEQLNGTSDSCDNNNSRFEKSFTSNLEASKQQKSIKILQHSDANRLKLWQKAFCSKNIISNSFSAKSSKILKHDVLQSGLSGTKHTEDYNKNLEDTTQNVSSKTLVTVMQKIPLQSSDSLESVFIVKTSTVEIPHSLSKDKSKEISNKSLSDESTKNQDGVVSETSECVSGTISGIPPSKNLNFSKSVSDSSKSVINEQPVQNKNLNLTKVVESPQRSDEQPVQNKNLNLTRVVESPQRSESVSRNEQQIQKCVDKNLSVRELEYSPRSKKTAGGKRTYRCLGCQVVFTDYQSMLKHYESHFLKTSMSMEGGKSTETQPESPPEALSTPLQDKQDNASNTSAIKEVQETRLEEVQNTRIENVQKTRMEKVQEAGTEEVQRTKEVQKLRMEELQELRMEEIQETNTSRSTQSQSKEYKKDTNKKRDESKKKNKIKRLHNANENNLTCTICAKLFQTKGELSTHIYLHTENELQQAYKDAIEKLDKEKESRDSIKSNKTVEQGNKNASEIDVQSIGAEVNDTNKSKETQETDGQNSSNQIKKNISKTSEMNVPLDKKKREISIKDSASTLGGESSDQNQARVTKLVAICECHNDELPQTDQLEIEMVLFCRLCRILFRRLECFMQHYELPNRSICKKDLSFGRVPKLFCSTCKAVFNSLPEMRFHLEMHNEKDKDITIAFLCNICKVAFLGVGSLFHTHWFSHSKNQFFTATRLSFPRISLIDSESERMKYLTPKRFEENYIIVAENVCRYCKKPFQVPPFLAAHEAECSKSCQSKTRDSQEATSSTAQTLPNEVLLSGAKKTDQRSKNIRITCSICKITFSEVSKYQAHAGQHMFRSSVTSQYTCILLNPTVKTYLCNICTTMFSSLLQFESHWSKHATMREEFICTKCNKTFDTFQSFSSHSTEHTNKTTGPLFCVVKYRESEFICKHCDIGFDCVQKLQQHSVKHKATVRNKTRENNEQVVQTQNAQPVMQDKVDVPMEEIASTNQTITDANIRIKKTDNNNININQSLKKVHITDVATTSQEKEDTQSNTIEFTAEAKSPSERRTTESSDRSNNQNEETIEESDEQLETLVDSDHELIIDEKYVPEDEENNSSTKTLSAKQKNDKIVTEKKFSGIPENSSTASSSDKTSQIGETKTVEADNEECLIINETAPPKRGFIRVKPLAELTEKTEHACPFCSLTFDKLEKLTEHSKLHSNNSNSESHENSIRSIENQDNTSPTNIVASVPINATTTTNIKNMTKSSVTIKPPSALTISSPLIGVVSPVSVQANLRNLRQKLSQEMRQAIYQNNSMPSYNNVQQTRANVQVQSTPRWFGQKANYTSTRLPMNAPQYLVNNTQNVTHYVLQTIPQISQVVPQISQTVSRISQGVPQISQGITTNSSMVTSDSTQNKMVQPQQRPPPSPYTASHALVRSFDINQPQVHNKIPIAPMPLSMKQDTRPPNILISSEMSQGNQSNNSNSSSNSSYQSSSADESSQKVLYCPFCPDFKCSRIIDYYRHELTTKHAARKQRVQNRVDKAVSDETSNTLDQRLKDLKKKFPGRIINPSTSAVACSQQYPLSSQADSSHTSKQISQNPVTIRSELQRNQLQLQQQPQQQPQHTYYQPRIKMPSLSSRHNNVNNLNTNQQSASGKTGNNIYVCDYCPNRIQYPTQKIMQFHMDISHNFICDVCGKRMYTPKELHIHKIKHEIMRTADEFQRNK